MKTPEEKYQNDQLYHVFVDVIEQHLHNAVYSPSEVREMAVLACIHYEQRRMRPSFNFIHLTDEFIAEEVKLSKKYTFKEGE